MNANRADRQTDTVKPLERVTLVLPPFSERPDQTPNREFHDYDRFAAELQQETPARVEILEGMPNRAPREGMLLISSPHGLDEKPGLIDRLAPGDPRPLLLNAAVSNCEELTQSWTPAGIVPSDRYMRWRLGQDKWIRHHLYGLAALAPTLAPLLIPESDAENPSSSIYRSNETLLLPPVVARYIDAYWRNLG